MLPTRRGWAPILMALPEAIGSVVVEPCPWPIFRLSSWRPHEHFRTMFPRRDLRRVPRRRRRVVVDGCPPGIALSLEDLERDLARRRPGARAPPSDARPTRPRSSRACTRGARPARRSASYSATPIRARRTTRPSGASPAGARRLHLALQVWRLLGSARLGALLGPGHGRPRRGGGHRQARARGGPPGARFDTRFVEAGGRPDVEAAAAEAKAAGDSVGGLVELRVNGLPPGLGEPFFDAAESRHRAPRLRRSRRARCGIRRRLRRGPHARQPAQRPLRRALRKDREERGGGSTAASPTATNSSSGWPSSPLPPYPPPSGPSISNPAKRQFSPRRSRHDACIALRAAVALEAACAIALADLTLAARQAPMDVGREGRGGSMTLKDLGTTSTASTRGFFRCSTRGWRRRFSRDP